MINRILGINIYKDIKLACILSSLAIIISYAFHSYGELGRIFLPIHFFVMVGAYILLPISAIIIAIFIPIISSLISGMPVLYPMLPLLIVELFTYVLVIVFLKKEGNYLSLITAMISGRVSAAVTVFILVKSMGLTMNPIRYIESSIITGLPGIIFQMIIIPIIITLINNHSSPWRDLHESI